MEKHTCKLCSRSFANGRALGGHMRSHMATLAPTPQPPKPPLVRNEISSASSSSASSSSSSEEEEEDDDEGKGAYYGLRENPKKSIRVVDPEFSFAVDAGSVVQDRESETESSKAPLRRRSKRNRKSAEVCDKLKLKAAADAEAEPLSSVSDTTPEEDVALSLMMLSRDIWMRDAVKLRFEESDESEGMKFCARGRSRFQCGTCKKVFRSYQALGGHRASHKKIRGCLPVAATTTSPVPPSSSRVHETESSEGRNEASPGVGQQQQHKIHECPVCFRVFGSGQALGGHKRSHLSGSATATTATAKFADNLIDLNLPPVDDDDVSQIELSAVSDAEFVDAGT